jgi:glycosyltransferase involved in cell wall biosynthesis
LGYGLYHPETGRSFGGAELQFFLLSQALAEDAAFRVSVLCTSDGVVGKELRGNLTLFTRQGGGRLRGSGGSWRGNVKVWSGYLFACVEMVRQFRAIDADVYVHAGGGAEVGAYALIARLLGKRFVFVVASTADLRDPSVSASQPLGCLARWGIHLAHAVICRSEDQQQLLADRYGRQGNLVRTAFPLSEVLPRERTVVLWVGRADAVKQPRLFLDLAERLPEESCVMVLMHDAQHVEEVCLLRERARRLSNVRLVGPLSWSEVGSLLVHAKVLVNTSVYEGFPNTFVQAALAHTPVASLHVDPDGVLSHDILGFCVGGDQALLVDRVRGLCRHPESRDALGQRACDYAENHHNLAAVIGTLKTVLRKTVLGSAGAHAYSV